MKRILVIGIVILAILTAEFYVGFLLGKNSSLVTVKVKNHSHHTITNATLEYYQGNRIISQIKKGKTKVGRFYSGEKNVFRMKVEFDNERVLFSATRYVSPGAMIMERVTDSLIISED